MFFLRDTSNPSRDLRRGFAFNEDALFDTQEEAIAWAQGRGSDLTPVQCPITKKWCGDPEPGLTGFAFADAAALAQAVERMGVHITGDTVQVFRGGEWTAGAGAKGEDCFVGAEHLFELPYPPTGADFEAAFDDWKSERYTQGYCHLFALALQKETNWGLCTLVDNDEPWDENTPTVTHVCASHPSGCVVDINGPRLEESLLDQFTIMNPEFIYPTEDELMQFVGNDRPLAPWTDAEWEMALEDAAELLRHEPDWDLGSISQPAWLRGAP